VANGELVGVFAADAAEAVEHLYAEYGALAFAAALGVLHDPARAEEAVQDSFMKLWKNSDRFDPGRGSMKTWVLTTVRNRSVDYLRGRHAHERQELELPTDTQATGLGADPWRHVASLVDRTALQDGLAKLPPKQREAIELAYLHGYRHPEIARLQGVPLSTVKGRIRLGIKKLHLYMRTTGLVFDAAHEELQNLIGPYLAGACQHGEAEVIETHLEMCHTCRKLVRKLGGSTARPQDPERSTTN
jgi:RNA polymerase sigma-70 factor (ECF subfamily)